jgi:uncharacterized protein (TIGR03437 family)
MLALVWVHNPAAAQTLQWARQFAASKPDATFSIAADSSGAYVVGLTRGGLPGQTVVNIQQDAFVRKYDPAGKELWTREFAVNGRPAAANGVAVDASGVYVVGRSELGNRQDEAPTTLAVVNKFDANGNLLWTHLTGGLSGESAVGVALNGGGVYVAGSMVSPTAHYQGMYLRKLDPTGKELWTSEFDSGRNGDTAYGVAADATGAYVVGWAQGSLTGQAVPLTQDLFIRKFDSNGNALWTDQFGTGSSEGAYAVSVGASSVYVVGTTQGLLGVQTLPTFAFDAFVRRYDTSGNLQWTRQFGTIDNEVAYGALADDSGVYVAGYTRSVVGAASLGGEDAFLRRYDSNGNALWTIQTGSVNDDYAYGVATDAAGIYIAGYTDRNTIPESLTNSADSFLYRYSPPPPAGPVVSAGGIVNNASYAANPAPVAPGSIAAIFGTGLNNGSQVLSSAFGPDGKLVTTLGGASVTVGGIPAPMFYSTSGQLGVQIPVEITGTSAAVQVTVGGLTSQPQTVNLAPVKPGLFTVSQDGRGAAVCMHTDGVTPVTASKPANPNEVIILYGTGFGPVTPPLLTGVPATLNQTVTPTVTIDGLSAQVQFSGIAPGFVGLNQINVVVPGLARTNAADPLVVSVNAVPANPVTLPVGPPQ